MDPVDPRDARIAELERMLTLALEQVRVLTARVAELERRLGDQSGGKPPAGSTSSKPKAEPGGRKPGGQPGHKGHRRELLVPTTVTECMPSTCRGCGETLPNHPDENPLRHQVIDLPPIKPTVDEFRLHRVTCECGMVTCATTPQGTPAGMLGPGLLAVLGLLTANGHVSRRKTQSFLLDVLNVRISLGALSESEELVGDALTAPVEEARAHAMAAEVKHADGTFCWGGGQRASKLLLSGRWSGVGAPLFLATLG